MATANVSQGLRGPAAVAKTITGWFIAMAVLFIILGILAIIRPGSCRIGGDVCWSAGF